MNINQVETKKGTSTGFSAKDVSEALLELVNSLGYDLLTMTPADKAYVAEKLSRVEGQTPPWTWRYVHNVLGRKIDASKRFGDAILKVLAILDGANPLMVNVKLVQVYATNVKPGAIVLPASKPCANPACPIEFVPVVPRQRFCSAACRKAAHMRVHANGKVTHG